MISCNFILKYRDAEFCIYEIIILLRKAADTYMYDVVGRCCNKPIMAYLTCISNADEAVAFAEQLGIRYPSRNGAESSFEKFFVDSPEVTTEMIDEIKKEICNGHENT